MLRMPRSKYGRTFSHEIHVCQNAAQGRTSQARIGSAVRCAVELLERRTLLSAAISPAEMQQLYGFRSASGGNQIMFGSTAGDGSTQTIAIVVAYANPTLKGAFESVDDFNQFYNLPRFDVGGPTLTIFAQPGTTAPPAGKTQWDTEAALDIEWAHAIAPGANIELFEAADDSPAGLMSAEASAASSGASVVSNSWSIPDSATTESTYDSIFASDPGVVFLGASGDVGAGPRYPSVNPNVISVGGTTVSINNDNTYGGEGVWSNSRGAGGGGISVGELQPSYQTGKVNGASSTNRVTPDVSTDADPFTGASLLDLATNNNNPSGYIQYGGTSLATPMWAGLIAIADQGRQVYNGGVPNALSSSQVLTALYDTLPSSSLRDVTAGNNGFPAATGYDMASGLGTPLANLVVQQLAGIGTTPHLAFANPPPSTVIAAGTGGLPNFTVNVEDAGNNIIGTDSSAVTLSAYYNGYNNGAELATGNMTVNAVNGAATFSNLWLSGVPNHIGSYVLQATDGNDVAATFNFTVVAAEPRIATSITGSPLASLPHTPSLYGGVTLDASGNLYVAAQASGSFNGAIYRVSSGGTTSLLHAFTGGADGSDPSGSLLIDASGNIWGTTRAGGDSSGDGAVFELSSSGALLQSFDLSVSTTGQTPSGGLVMDSSGNLYGTAYGGGDFGSGDVFKVSGGSLTRLAAFDDAGLGANPLGGLAIDPSGDLFGTTSGGGAGSGTSFGTLFEVRAGSSTITTLTPFDGASVGGSPRAAPAIDAGKPLRHDVPRRQWEQRDRLRVRSGYESPADGGVVPGLEFRPVQLGRGARCERQSLWDDMGRDGV